MPSRESLDGGQRIELAGPTAIGDAVASARLYVDRLQLAPRDQARFCIIVEELLTNLVEHGGPGLGRPIAIEFSSAEARLALAVEDEGPPFDPRSWSDKGAIPDRGGGAGLRLVREWSEIVSYESAGGRNRLELAVPLTGS